MKTSQLTDEQMEKIKQMDELHYEITCKDDVAHILDEHKKLLNLLMDTVGLLAREANIRIDRTKAKG